jgi:hypothetical protein
MLESFNSIWNRKGEWALESSRVWTLDKFQINIFQFNGMFEVYLIYWYLRWVDILSTNYQSVSTPILLHHNFLTIKYKCSRTVMPFKMTSDCGRNPEIRAIFSRLTTSPLNRISPDNSSLNRSDKAASKLVFPEPLFSVKCYLICFDFVEII